MSELKVVVLCVLKLMDFIMLNDNDMDVKVI